MSVIPKEQLGGFRRWQVNSFDQQPAASPLPAATETVAAASVATAEEPSSKLNLPTAEEIGRIQEEARQSGYDAGFEEGMAAARKAGENITQEALAGISRLLANFETALGELDQSVANQLLDMAIETASQLSRAALKVKADYLLPIIREAISSLPLHHAHITLHLNPVDAAQVRPLIAEQMSHHNLQLQENTDIAPGGCRLLAGTSEVDATIETRWCRILESIGAEPQEWLIQK